MEQHRKNIHTKAPQQKHINSIRNSRSFYHKNSNSTTYRFCCSCKVIAWSILEKYVLCRTAVIWTSVDCYVSSVYLFRCFTCFFCFVSVLNYTKNMSQIYLVMKYEKILSSHRAKFAHSQTNQGIHSLLYKKKKFETKKTKFSASEPNFTVKRFHHFVSSLIMYSEKSSFRISSCLIYIRRSKWDPNKTIFFTFFFDSDVKHSELSTNTTGHWNRAIRTSFV